MKQQLYAGVGRADITPAVGGRLFGYRPDHHSKSVNDRLSLTAAAFCQGDTKAILISATLGLFGNGLSDEIRALIAAETGFPHVVLTATHTHSGPDTCGIVGWGDVDRKYCDSILIPRIKEAAKEAAASLKPVILGIGTVQSKVGINRRQHNEDGSTSLGQNPWGVYDPTMTVLRFTEPDGKPVLNIVHYGCHCTAAGMNTEITRDWAGVMLDRLEKESGAPSLYLNGSAGDVGPRLPNAQTTGDLSHAIELGGAAALDAVRAWRNAKNGKPENLSVTADALKLPLKARMPYAEAKRLFNEMSGADGINLSGQVLNYYRSIIAAYDKKLPEEKVLTLPQTLIAVGDAVIVPFPFEIFSEISMRLREYSPYPYTLCTGCANGANGYLPSQAQLCRGGYEVDFFRTGRVQPFADDTDDNFIKENLRLIRKIKK